MSTPVPPELWGKDHLSTLLYVETRCVDHRGFLSRPHMREASSNYPTRLADGTEIRNHGDWECLEDMAAAGLLVELPGDRVKLTDAGWQRAWELRKARAARD